MRAEALIRMFGAKLGEMDIESSGFGWKMRESLHHHPSSLDAGNCVSATVLRGVFPLIAAYNSTVHLNLTIGLLCVVRFCEPAFAARVFAS
jgi:hypothetical protein